MPSSNLICLGGLVAVAAGVLFVVSNLLVLAEDPEDPIGGVSSASYGVSVGLALCFRRGWIQRAYSFTACHRTLRLIEKAANPESFEAILRGRRGTLWV